MADAAAKIEVRVISIGVLDAHPLRGERERVRAGHATTTLIRAGGKTIVVDPGLPGPILEARLQERAGLAADQVSHVFLTSFRPDARRGLALFEDATWWINNDEREALGVPLAEQLRHAEETNDAELRAALMPEVALLHRCQAAPDQLAEGVGLFPLPGVTPGCAGLLVALPEYTLLVCGDSIPTWEHLEKNEAPRWSTNLEQARASFAEALEIADLLILGRDNLMVNPRRGPF